MNGQQKNGMAITSLVLGIFVPFTCGLTAIPAIILGHIAHNRARKSPSEYGGAGMAIAGYVLGYCSILMVPVLAGMLLPAFAKAKSRAQTIACVNNMKQITIAARLYSIEHTNVFPSTFQEMKGELGSPRVLICPAEASKKGAGNIDWSNFNWADVSYELVAPGATDEDPTTVYVRCPVHENTGLIDGSVHQKSKR
jgi:hypothetical protein